MPGLFAVSASAVILRDDAVLILRRSAAAREAAGAWDTPKGRLEQDETVTEALHREVAEETGLAVEVVAVVNTFRRMHKDGQAVIGVTHLCRWRDGEVRLSPEHSEFRWLPLAELAAFPMPEPMRQSIREAAAMAKARAA